MATSPTIATNAMRARRDRIAVSYCMAVDSRGISSGISQVRLATLGIDFG
jgi:hypothetical protein